MGNNIYYKYTPASVVRFKCKNPETEFPRDRKKLTYHLMNTFERDIYLSKSGTWWIHRRGKEFNTMQESLSNRTYSWWEDCFIKLESGYQSILG